MLVHVFDAHRTDELDYYLDWTPFLAGDTIVTSAWTVTAGTITLTDEEILGNFTSFWTAPPVVGDLIDCTNVIETAEGRVTQGTLRLRMRD